MKKKRSFGPVIISSLFFLLLLTAVSCATATITDPLGPRALEPIPRREGIVNGRFDNGLSYAVYRNAEPANRISLRLVVRAGSILEEDDQLGIAHLVEHMAFNGTEHFKENELIRWAESVGMGFGPEVNAYTSYEETVYMLEIPADDPATLDTALLILADWAGRISFDPVELDKERGVVIEEWRQGRNLQGRMRDELVPFLMADSPYANRQPIGDPQIIRTIDRQRVVDFYETWYRPELMSVVIVGDIESSVVVSGLEKTVALLPAKEGPDPVRQEIPHPKTPSLRQMRDPEFGYTLLQLFNPSTSIRSTSLGNFRRNLARDILLGALNQRLQERKESAGEIYLELGAGISKYPGELDYSWVYMVPSDRNFDLALQGLLAELDYLAAEGLSLKEIETEQQKILARARKAYDERANESSSSIIAELQSEYLYGRIPFSPQTAWDLANEFVPGIDPSSIAKEIELLFSNRMRLGFLMSRNPNDTIPGKDEVFVTWRAWKNPEATKARSETSDRPLATESNEAPGSIVSETILLDPQTSAASSTGRPEKVVEWTLSNGMRVIAIPTNFKDDEIIMTAMSWGGYSFVNDEDFYNIFVARQYRELSGLNDHSPTALDRLLAGKTVNAGIWMEDHQEGLWGSSSVKDLETLVQLLSLQFSASSYTSAAWDSLLVNLRAEASARQTNPNASFNKLINSTLFPNTPRVLFPGLEDIDALDRQKSEALVRSRYANAADFTVAFVGSLDLDVLKSHVSRWFAGLPGAAEREAPIDHYPAFPEGVQRKELVEGAMEQSLVYMATGGSIPLEPGDEELQVPFAGLMEMRLRNRIREDLGATYHVSINGGIDWYPTQRHLFQLSFGCEPSRSGELADTVLEVLRELVEEGPTSEEVTSLREQRRRSLETDSSTNRFWLDQVMHEIKNNRPLSRIADEERLLEPLTKERLHDFARRYINLDNRLEAILYPEEKEK